MIRVTFLYPQKPGSRFDADYYINVHMPLAISLLEPALKGVTAEIGLSSAIPGSAPPNAAIATLIIAHFAARCTISAIAPAAAARLWLDLP